MTENLPKKRILLVEDSPVVSFDAEQTLHDCGYHVVGPAHSMAAGIELAGREQIDAAVVDLNIRGGKAFAVLRVLAERNIPFLITSGYADWSMPPEWLGRPRLSKPYSAQLLGKSVADLLAGTPDDARA